LQLGLNQPQFVGTNPQDLKELWCPFLYLV